MNVWKLRPRFDQRENRTSLGAEIVEVGGEGDERELEILQLKRDRHPEVWAPEGLLEQLVQKQIDQGRLQLILDLQTLEKADSTEIGEIVAAVHRTSESGGELLLTNLTPKIREIFRRTELDRMIPVCDSVADARRRFGA